MAALIAVLAATTFTVSQNEYAVVTRFGKPVRTIKEPGLNFQLPRPIHRVNRFDKRLQIHRGLLLESLTRDKKNIAVRTVVIWTVADPAVFFVSVGSMEAAAQKLDDILTSKGAGAIGDFSFDDLISVENPVKIPELEKRIQTELAETLTQGGYGMKIHAVEMDRLALPEANAYAVYQRMRKERNAIANKYRAEGEEQAARIRAEADREKSEILSEAYETAQKIRGEGEAEASRIYAEAFSRNQEFYRFWRTLESYKKILDKKTTLVLSQDSELLKYLGE